MIKNNLKQYLSFRPLAEVGEIFNKLKDLSTPNTPLEMTNSVEEKSSLSLSLSLSRVPPLVNNQFR